MKFTLTKLAAALGLASLVALPGPAQAWGAQGHRTIAAIRRQKLLGPAKVQAMNAPAGRQSEIEQELHRQRQLRRRIPPDLEPQTKPWHFADLVDGRPDFPVTSPA